LLTRTASRLVVVDALWGRLATGVTIACALVLAGTLALFFSPALRARLGLGAPVGPAYVAGDRIDLPAELYGATPATLFIFARSTCSSCQRAQPVLAAAVHALRATPGVAIRLVPTRAPDADELGYARAIGLREADVTPVTMAQLRLRVVPTVVLVDREGRIRFSVEGVLSETQEAELVRSAATVGAAR